jgi:hypothetical protein
MILSRLHATPVFCGFARYSCALLLMNTDSCTGFGQEMKIVHNDGDE